MTVAKRIPNGIDLSRVGVGSVMLSDVFHLDGEPVVVTYPWPLSVESAQELEEVVTLRLSHLKARLLRNA